MKKHWKILIAFEIIILIVFLGSWFVYENNWMKEKFIEDNKNFNQGIYQPIISQINTSTGCQYNVEIQINPDKIAKNNVHLYKIPN